MNSSITYDELRKKILSGYAYKMYTPGDAENRAISLMTGKGGAIMIVDRFEQMGMPAIFAAEQLLVDLKERGWARLADVTVTDKNHEHADEQKPDDL